MTGVPPYSDAFAQEMPIVLPFVTEGMFARLTGAFGTVRS
jgi:hypothetical protein